jgi:NIMA-interacting peptidyl-prolyl cis-trans isomerase 1
MKTSALLGQLKGTLNTGHVAVSSETAAQALQAVEVPESLKHLPKHILRTCPLSKLVLQAPYFECPEWADRPDPLRRARFDVHKPPAAPRLAAEVLPAHKIDLQPNYLIGQSEKLTDIRQLHPSISRLHCAIVNHRTGAVFVIDLNSANGVRVNGTRLAAATYTQLNAGDELTLGGSTRVLTLRIGAPATGAAASSPSLTTEAASAEPAASASTGSKRPRADDAAADSTVLAAGRPQPSAEALPQEPATTAPPVSAQKVTVMHLLLKHKDTANPVSKAPRNKGQVVTRSKEDAVRTAAGLKARCFQSPPISVSAFAEMVEKFSECATAKNGGKMPTIERGTFTPTFEDAAFALQDFHVSDPVETPLGIHLILRLPDETVS